MATACLVFFGGGWRLLSGGKRNATELDASYPEQDVFAANVVDRPVEGLPALVSESAELLDLDTHTSTRDDVVWNHSLEAQRSEWFFTEQGFIPRFLSLGSLTMITAVEITIGSGLVVACAVAVVLLDISILSCVLSQCWRRYQAFRGISLDAKSLQDQLDKPHQPVPVQADEKAGIEPLGIRLALSEAMEERDVVEIGRLLALGEKYGADEHELNVARAMLEKELEKAGIEPLGILLALSEAIEERDVVEIRRLLDLGEKYGADEHELNVARAILEKEGHKMKDEDSYQHLGNPLQRLHAQSLLLRNGASGSKEAPTPASDLPAVSNAAGVMIESGILERHWSGECLQRMPDPSFMAENAGVEPLAATLDAETPVNEPDLPYCPSPTADEFAATLVATALTTAMARLEHETAALAATSSNLRGASLDSDGRSAGWVDQHDAGDIIATMADPLALHEDAIGSVSPDTSGSPLAVEAHRWHDWRGCDDGLSCGRAPSTPGRTPSHDALTDYLPEPWLYAPTPLRSDAQVRRYRRSRPPPPGI
jgi:hypothetical protein